MIDFDFDSGQIPRKLKVIQNESSTLGILRLAAFIGTLALFILGLTENPLWLIAAGIVTLVFIRLIQKSNLLKDQQKIYLALITIQDHRLLRENRILDTLDQGLEYADKNHPFAGDLDLFGKHSLFQLLNHATSPQGKKDLAALMKSSFDPEGAQDRAVAVRELAEKKEFLQAMESVAMAFQKDQKKQEGWVQWLEKSEKIHPVLFGGLALLGPVGGLTILALIQLGILPAAILGVWILVGVGFLSFVFNPLKQAADSIPSALTLKSYALRTRLIEAEEFASPRLQAERHLFVTAQVAVSQRLQELDRLGLWAQNRLNLLYVPINLLFWTDFLLVLRLVGWKKKVGTSLSHLPQNLEKWEVWISLGAFESELGGKGKAAWVPDLSIDAKNLTHPLILPGKAVSNSLTFDEARRLVILTGANMSGKTTFMRTLGINCVLANLGLSPYGEALSLGPIQLFTSMRNADNLGESVSSFYAELSRIHRLIERLEAGEPVFFLLDEILKGTNTQDRIAGSEALIRQILQTRGMGIISTHDIELSELPQNVEKVHNYSFRSEIHDKSIDFDYTLQNGPCPSFNAHKLMELMGIRFEG